MNAIECDLKGFNYKDMDNLKIDSDDNEGDISVWKTGQDEKVSTAETVRIS